MNFGYAVATVVDGMVCTLRMATTAETRLWRYDVFAAMPACVSNWVDCGSGQQHHHGQLLSAGAGLDTGSSVLLLDQEDGGLYE